MTPEDRAFEVARTHLLRPAEEAAIAEAIREAEAAAYARGHQAGQALMRTMCAGVAYMHGHHDLGDRMQGVPGAAELPSAPRRRQPGGGLERRPRRQRRLGLLARRLPRGRGAHALAVGDGLDAERELVAREAGARRARPGGEEGDGEGVGEGDVRHRRRRRRG